MQKRELNKLGSGFGGTTAPPPKRGRPFGSGSNSAAAVAAAVSGDSASPSNFLGPYIQVQSIAAEKSNRRIVLALQSGLKSEIIWALNALTLLSFKEKDDFIRNSTPLSKIPGVLDALLQIIDDWRLIALPRILTKAPRVGLFGMNSVVTGFGNEYEILSAGSGSSNKCMSAEETIPKNSPSGWWYEEDGIFNLDDEGRMEKQMCAVAASNVLRNFSFMADNEIAMGQNHHCLETMFQCLEDYVTEDEELVSNALEIIMNLGPLIDFRIFSSSKSSYIKMTEKRAVQAIMGMLGSAVKAWHCAAAELIGRLILNPDNEPFLLLSGPQIYKRLVDIMSFPAVDSQAAAVSALYNLAEINIDCRLKLASERWAIDRLLKVIRTPHQVPEICRRAALILESLVLEPQCKPFLLAYENAFADMVFSDMRYSETFSRILFELTARPSSKSASNRGIWGV